MFALKNRTNPKERANLLDFINELFPDDLEFHLEVMKNSKAGQIALQKYLAETAEAEKEDKKNNPKNNDVQGPKEQSKVQEDDDSLMYSWHYAMVNNPTGFKSLHPLVQTTMTSKVRSYHLRRAAAYAAANGGVISSGIVTTKVPSGEKDSEVEIKQTHQKNMEQQSAVKTTNQPGIYSRR